MLFPLLGILHTYPWQFLRLGYGGRVEQEKQCLPTVALTGGARGSYVTGNGLFFGDVAPFLPANPEQSPVTNQKLLEMLQNSTVKASLQTELVTVVDAGEAFVKATYSMEGNGPVVLT